MITFIIPSIGRKTLEESIQSIKNQTCEDWKIIIIFDGIQSTITETNTKITILESHKQGEGTNSAGAVRNFGMQRVDTEWVAFLDDDDIISPNYIETFNKEIEEHPQIDVLIFRMSFYNDLNIVLPKLETDNFYQNEVGISFVIKTEIFNNGLKFIPSCIEDFNYLQNLKENKYIIMISPYTRYIVRGYIDLDIFSKINEKLGNRVILNN